MFKSQLLISAFLYAACPVSAQSISVSTVAPILPANLAGDNTLAELNKKEAAEIKAIWDKFTIAQKKLRDELAGYQTQIETIKEKYRKERYTLMDRIEPGSGTRLALRDKQLDELEYQFRKELEALEETRKEERKKTPNSEGLIKKLDEDKKVLVETYMARKRDYLKQAAPLPSK